MTEMKIELQPGVEFDFVDDACGSETLNWRQTGNTVHIDRESYDIVVACGVDLSAVLADGFELPTDTTGARLSALEAALSAINGTGNKFPTMRVEDLPQLSASDEGTTYFSPNAYKHRPGLVVWDGRYWRRVKDGNYTHTNRWGKA